MQKKLIGDKQFYKMVMAITLPIMIQNGITNFVSLLDNIMVGRVGTTQMTGVAIANQLVFVFNLCVFGAVSGAGIFTAQFYGKNDQKGISDTMRFKLYIGTLITILGAILFFSKGEALVSLYLKGEGSPEDIAASLACGVEYLHVMVIGFLPFIIVQCYASTLRETGETTLPMIASVSAVAVNLTLNYVLIFGAFGIPAYGAVGAAIATVISRYVEMLIVVIWTHTHKERNPFIRMLYQTAKIPAALTKHIIIKGMPLMMNELLWSIGMAALAQCYSYRGYDVVSANNISSTISNLFNVVAHSIGSAVSIIIGQLLGAGKMEEAVDTDSKLVAFSTGICVAVGAVMYVLAPLFPLIYNTTEAVRTLATALIRVTALCLPISAFLNACYFTLRSGGKTIITFLFDSVFVLGVSYPVAYLLAHYTALPIVPLYLSVLLLDLLKCVVGFVLVKRRVWVHNIIEDKKEKIA